MLHRRLSAITVLVLTVHLGVSAGNAQTVTLTFQEGVAGYAGCVDTTLVSNPCDAPETPHGNDSIVGIDCCDANPACQNPNLSCPDHGLLRFDSIFGNGPNQIPLGSTIVSAELTVNVVPTGADNVTTTIHRMLLPFTEDDTWCQWGNGTQADGNEAAAAVDATLFAPYGVGPLEIDLTQSLQAWSAGESNYGWAFLPGSVGNFGWAFSSCDNGTSSIRPKLEVTFEPSDSDNDGVADDVDACPDSDLSDTIVIDECDTGVSNLLFDDGCTMADRIAECAEDVTTHGEFVSCVAQLTNDWKQDGLVSGREKGRIQRCAAQADVP